MIRKVFDAQGVYVAMRIINHGSKTLPVIRPLICNQFSGLTGFPQRHTRAEVNGGLIEQDMDAALSMVTSLDQQRKVIFWWNPGKSMIANSFIPCIHADPYFGTLNPGEEAYAEGLILFTQGEAEPIIKYLKGLDKTNF